MFTFSSGNEIKGRASPLPPLNTFIMYVQKAVDLGLDVFSSSWIQVSSSPMPLMDVMNT